MRFNLKNLESDAKPRIKGGRGRTLVESVCTQSVISQFPPQTRSLIMRASFALVFAALAAVVVAAPAPAPAEVEYV